MFRRISSLAVFAALIGSLMAISPSLAYADDGNNPNRNRLDVPISGVVAGLGNLTGRFAISKFAIQGGQLVAIGQLTGQYVDLTGQTRTIVSTVAWPVADGGSAGADAAASCDTAADTGRACDILELVLGPLHLDLLGLVVDLNQVILTITGTTGAGDLLGNLLCAITGLLDAGSLGQQVVNLLNQLVGMLAGL